MEHKEDKINYSNSYKELWAEQDTDFLRLHCQALSDH